MRIPRAQQRAFLLRVAHKAMVDRGLEPDFSKAVLAEVAAFDGAPPAAGGAARDQRELLWCSIDNDDSRDLDQLTVAETGSGGSTRIRVAVADVSAFVTPGSALDEH